MSLLEITHVRDRLLHFGGPLFLGAPGRGGDDGMKSLQKDLPVAIIGVDCIAGIARGRDMIGRAWTFDA